MTLTALPSPSHMPEQRDPERISIEDIRTLIAEVMHQNPAADPGDFSQTSTHRQPDLAEIREQIAREQLSIDDRLRSAKPVFVVNQATTRRIHAPSCHSIRHQLDREMAWQIFLDNFEHVDINLWGMVSRMPTLMSRAEVEALNSYVACQTCAPTLDHQKKRWVLNSRPMLATSIGPQHLGRSISTPDGDPLGTLVSHQRIVSAAGIESITTTTEHVLRGDGTEKFHLAPKADESH